MKKETAFTGLEAAIVLIAFVVVAAVFSFVLLSAGFFSTQKSQEVTYAGIKGAVSNVILDGQIYGNMNGTQFCNLSFFIRVPEGGESVKLNEIIFLYSRGNDQAVMMIPYNSTNQQFTESDRINPGANTKINLWVSGPTRGSRFTLEIKPRLGASSLIQRTIDSGYTGGVLI